MKDYEILLYIKSFKDSTGKKAFRASADFMEHKTEDGKTIRIPCSFYRTQKTSEESEEIIEVRAADHGTVLRTWNHLLHPHPWENRYNLDIEFLNEPKAQNDLDGNTQFFVVDQWLYDNATITTEDLNAILTTIVSLGEEDYKDPTGKAVRHTVLTPNDAKGRDIADRSNVHPHQLEVLKKYEDEKAAKDMEKKKKTDECRVVRINENDIRTIVAECVRMVLFESSIKSRRHEDHTYHPIGSHKFWTNNGKTEMKSIVTLQNPSSKQCCHIAEDDHCYVLFNGSGLNDKNCEMINYIFPEAFKALKALPLL